MDARTFKTKLTPQVQEKICKVLSSIGSGVHYTTACAYAGVNYNTFRAWMKRGEEEPYGIYRDFYNAVKKAEAEAEEKLIKILNDAAPGDWRAALAMLERRWPERWAKREKLDVEGETEFVVRWATGDKQDELEQQNEVDPDDFEELAVDGTNDHHSLPSD